MSLYIGQTMTLAEADAAQRTVFVFRCIGSEQCYVSTGMGGSPVERRPDGWRYSGIARSAALIRPEAQIVIVDPMVAK